MQDLELQRSLVESALDVPLTKGASWCVLSRRWFDAFAHYVGLRGVQQSGASPGRMFISELMAGKEMKEGLLEGEDFVVVPRAVFELLHGWYRGSDAITRTVIEEGEGSKAILRVEVYLLKLRIVQCDAKGALLKAHVVHYSKKERVHDVLARECPRLGLDVGMTRVFTMDGDGDELLEETMLVPSTVLEDALLAPMQRLCLQGRAAGDKDWPPLPSGRLRKNGANGGSATAPGGGGGFFRKLFGKKESKDNSRNDEQQAVELAANPPPPAVVVAAASPYEADTSKVAVSEQGGMCGLNNLGNTCFMNGAVQALLHAEPLVKYFLAGIHRKELNKKNPLGMKGELALALGDLMKEVWRSSGGAATPKQLKHVIGRFAPQFQGYMQHDAHELLAFLLDGVHEDLNRVLEKPFVDLDADHLAKDLDDAQRAAVFWNKHHQRNQSVIVDLFHAQLRSTIVCPAVTAGGCGRQSVTYDAFAYLSLPLPGLSSEKRFIEIAMVRDPGLEYGPWFCEMPIKYSVETLGTDGIVNVMENLVSMATSDPAQRHAMDALTNGTNSVLLTEQLHYKVFKLYQAGQSASIIPSRELLFGFSLPRGSEELLYTHISFSHAKPYGAALRSGAYSMEWFGLPFMAAFLIDVPASVLSVYQTCYRAIACYFRDAHWTTVGEPVFLASESPTNEEILAAKSEMQRRGPPEGSVPRDGCWRVDYRKWEGEDANKGRTVVRYQVLKNKTQLSTFPFKLRWSCDSFNSTCIRCGQRACEGCDVVKTADVQGKEPEEHMINFLALRGRLAMVLFWEDEAWRSDTLELGSVLNVRLHASVKANRAIVANGGRKEGLTLQDCLSHFQLNEKLDANNMWYCNVCKAHKEAWKMMQVHTLPVVLVIQLKRFKTSGHYRQKLNYPVQFPLEGLDLTPFVLAPREEGWVYDCFAVVNHSGDLGGGHYTAYAKHSVTRTWHHFDDSRVSPVSESSVVSSAAYILFYVRRDKSATDAK